MYKVASVFYYLFKVLEFCFDVKAASFTFLPYFHIPVLYNYDSQLPKLSISPRFPKNGTQHLTEQTRSWGQASQKMPLPGMHIHTYEWTTWKHNASSPIYRTDRSIKITLYLLSNIECSAVCLWMAPVTAENLAKYWIVRLLQALQESVYKQLIYSAFQCSKYQYGYSTINYLMRWHLNHDKLQKTEALIFIFNLQSNITEYTRKQLVGGLYSKQVTTK